MEWIKPGTNIDFVGKRVYWISASLAVVAFASFLVVCGFVWQDFPLAPKLGVDFSGGTEIHLKVAEGVDIAQVRSAVRQVGLSDNSVQSYGGSGREFLVRVQAVNYGADDFFDRAVAKLKETHGEAAWKSFDWQRGQSVAMSAVAAESHDLAEIQATLAQLDGKVVVTESKVEHNAFDISYPGLQERVAEQLRGALGANPDGTPRFSVERVEMVGPAAGAELQRKAAVAVFFSLILILIYVAFRFDLAFAPGGVIALLHDVMITVLVFCLLGREFNLQTIGALLTIVGYSINDTIVIYDRIRENMVRYPRRDLAELINLSLNETLSRTILTAGTVILALAGIMALGGPVVFDFALALLVGAVVGSYSSLYIAAPITLFLQKWLPVDVRSKEEASGRSHRSSANAGARL